MDENLNQEVRLLLEEQVEAGRQVGVQVAAYVGGVPLVSTCAGRMGKRDHREIRADSLINAFSVSKGLAGLAVHMLADRGALSYDAPVAEYWPAFAQNGKSDITVGQVLTHQAGLYRMPRPLTTEFVTDWEAGIQWVEEMAPAHPPGSGFFYHAHTYAWISGGIVHGASGVHIRDFLATEIATPLGIASELYFGIPDGVEDRLTTLSAGGTPGARAGMSAEKLPPDHPSFEAIPPDSSLNYNDMRMRRSCHPAATGHMSARALARVYAALANDGSVDGVRLVTPARIAEMQRIWIRGVEGVGGQHALQGVGFALGSDEGVRAMGPRATAFGYHGNGGAVGFADPEIGLAVAVLPTMLQDTSLTDGPTFQICEFIRDSLRSR